jgi:hypothetical protein
MDDLRAGIERAGKALKRGLEDGATLPGPWDNLVALLERASEHAQSGDNKSALRLVDEVLGRLKMLAMMSRGASFENMSMEEARREALRTLDNVPRNI